MGSRSRAPPRCTAWRATIVVPHGNSVEKNAAMRALGATLVEFGDDFQHAREHAAALAEASGLHMVPSFHRDLVRGVASYWIEFFEQAQPDVVLVPIGQGSGICACAAARAYTGAASRIVGVVSAHATAYQDSFEAGRVIEAPVSTQLADGMACRVPDAQALASSGARSIRSSPSATTRWPRPCASTSATPTTWPKAPVPRRWPPRCSGARPLPGAAWAWR